MAQKIFIICPGPEGSAPGKPLKYEQCFEHWQENDYNITVKPFISESFQKTVYKKDYLALKFYHTILEYVSRIKTLSQLRHYDIVYIFLQVTPFGFPFFEMLYCAIAQRVTYDIDDLVYTTNKKAP